MSTGPLDDTFLQQTIARAFEEHRFEDAIRLLEPRAWRTPDPELWNNLGALYFQLQWLPEAEAAFRRALRLEPAHGSATTNLVDALLYQGLPFSALQVLRAAEASGAPPELWQEPLRALEARYPVRRVSIYTPGFASEAFIERCLNSIEAQTYPVHEILLVDDRSPDRSTAIALEHGVRVFYHEENLGLAASCNTALEHCTGEFLAKIDTDLELDRTWLERIMLQFESDKVAGVGGRLIEHRTTTVPDQWRRIYMQQHWGTERIVNPVALFGADCLFRVSALRAVEGWNARYRTNFEDFDLSQRLKDAGFTLIYEPQACARHLRNDSLEEVVRNCWNWHHPPKQDQGGFDSLAHAALCIPLNFATALKTLNNTLQLERTELLYPSFLLGFWWCLRDLQQVLRRKSASLEAVSQTALGVFLLVRHQLYTSPIVPGRVVERTLVDLKAYVRTFLAESEREVLESEVALEQLLPSRLQPSDALVSGLRRQLSLAETRYFEVFQQQGFASHLGIGMGALIEQSVRAVTEGELEHGETSRGRPGCVIFNPPVLNPGPMKEAGRSGPEEEPPVSTAARRWLHPARIDALAAQLRAGGFRVLLVDAVALQLDLREAHERVIGMDPRVVMYSAADGDLERLAVSARYLALTGGGALSLALVQTGAAGEQVTAEHYPMFDEVHAGLPAWG